MDLNPKQALGCSPAFDLGPYTGAVLLGTFISLALWGMSFQMHRSLISPFLDRYRDNAIVRLSLRKSHDALNTKTRFSASFSLLSLFISSASTGCCIEELGAKALILEIPGV